MTVIKVKYDRFSRITKYLLVLLLIAPFASDPLNTAEKPEFRFREIWGYLMKGEERELTGEEPFTDVCYFSAAVGPLGRLVGVPELPKPGRAGKSNFRTHLVITELSNHALTHFILDPSLPLRKSLVEDIVNASRGYHGIQIDFESVLPNDARFFWSFLSDIRKSLPKSAMLSVALPARKNKTADAYDYASIAPIVDRVIIMAYDQHWSTSAPGPVGSVPWCREILAHARSAVPRDKLVMGLPLYGRAWQEKSHGRALRHRHVVEILESRKITPTFCPDNGYHFEYEEPVKVKVFYDDVQSTLQKIRLYHDSEVASLAFWRIGQGPVALWTHLANPGPETITEIADTKRE